jgi:hypothetical protein
MFCNPWKSRNQRCELVTYYYPNSCFKKPVCPPCPTTTTTTTIPLVPQRCTAIGNGVYGPESDAGYRMENSWNDEQSPNPPDGIYQFQIINLTLSGTPYSSGQIITITAPNDLVLGPGIFGGTYVQNINDWLNSIPGVSGSGFVFYDDMSTVDVPDVSSTYEVLIRRTVVRTGSIYDYHWFKTSTVTGWNFGNNTSGTLAYGGAWGCVNL